MTISRSRLGWSDWRIWVAWLAIVSGTGGYAYCWSILWDVQTNLAADRQLFERRTEQRSFEIEWKGRTFFVEPAEGRPYEDAHWLISYIWAAAAGGFIYLLWRASKGRQR